MAQEWDIWFLGRMVGHPPEMKREGMEKPWSVKLLCLRPAPVQYEGPGVEMLFSPAEDADAHNLFRLRQRFSGLACCLGLMLR